MKTLESKWESKKVCLLNFLLACLHFAYLTSCFLSFKHSNNLLATFCILHCCSFASCLLVCSFPTYIYSSSNHWFDLLARSLSLLSCILLPCFLAFLVASIIAICLLGLLFLVPYFLLIGCYASLPAFVLLLVLRSWFLASLAAIFLGIGFLAFLFARIVTICLLAWFLSIWFLACLPPS